MSVATERLNSAMLAHLPTTVGRPSYDRDVLAPGIVHLGVGAFHRAHQAVYTELALEQAWGPWGICGVSMRRPDVRDRLTPQDGLYTVAARDGAREGLRVIGCLKEILVAPEEPAAVVRRIADPGVSVVTLTITEKGYCHDPASGRLDLAHADIRHDLGAPEQPRSALGMLVAGLDRRRRRQVAPPTILSCDNLPANGRTLRGLAVELAARRDEPLARWIEREVAFPGTMVDRIVPAATDADLAQVAARLGVHDAAAVVCERFRQWVIEDRFAGPRPAWELAGAEIVGDVAPYEEMKLRLLNGSHSALAYLGYLAGFEHIFQVMQAPAFVTFMRRMMAEVAPTLHVPADLDAYQATLVARFANPALAFFNRPCATSASHTARGYWFGGVIATIPDGRPPLIGPTPRLDSRSSCVSFSRFLNALSARCNTSGGGASNEAGSPELGSDSLMTRSLQDKEFKSVGAKRSSRRPSLLFISERPAPFSRAPSLPPNPPSNV